MKKIVSLLVALMMACMLIPATAEIAAETITGDWYCSEMTQGETTFNPGAMGMEVHLIINEDGTVSVAMTMGGEGQTEEGTWEITDGKLFMHTGEGETASDVELVLQEDGTLKVAEETSGTVMIFGREAPEGGVELAEVNPDAQAEDFNGDWTFAYVSVSGMTLTAEMAVSMGAFEEAPTMKLEDGNMTLSGLSTLLGDEPMALEFANGAYTVDFGEGLMTIRVEMLQDGMACLTVAMGGEDYMGLYFTKAE